LSRRVGVTKLLLRYRRASSLEQHTRNGVAERVKPNAAPAHQLSQAVRLGNARKWSKLLPHWGEPASSSRDLFAKLDDRFVQVCSPVQVIGKR